MSVLVKATFEKRGGKLVAVDVKGHSGYAEESHDIICSAVSSAMMLIHALMYDVQKIPVNTLIESEGAHIRISLPEAFISQGQEALRALEIHFTELNENYPEYLNAAATEVL